MQMLVPKGRVNYEPNSLDPADPRENPTRGFTSFSAEDSGGKVRIRPESFADHYSQARLFFRSQTQTEQNHIVAALIFELSKVETVAIRERVVSHLLNIDKTLAQTVAKGLGLPGTTPFKAAVAPHDMKPSPALSILKKAKPTLKGRVVGLLVGDGADAGLVAALRKGIEDSGAKAKVVAEKIAGATLSDGNLLPADFRIDGGPSCLFDAVAIVVTPESGAKLAGMAAAQDFVHDAYGHLKVIGASEGAHSLFEKAGIDNDAWDAGCIALAKRANAQAFVDAAAKGKIWGREPRVRPLP